ncbi:MmcQ/YjbR family DNA-binding protein [Nocardioides pacificus]
MAHPVMFDEDDPVLARLRGLCLTFPGAEEIVSHGRPTYRIGKIFAVYGGGVKVRPGEHEPHPHALLFKADALEIPALDEDPRFFLPAYYGPFGWRGIDLDGEGKDAPDWTEIGELVDASYRIVAPRRRVAELDDRLS